MSSSDIVYTGDKSKAVLVGVINSSQDENKVQEYLDELEFLATTDGIETLKRYVQKLASIHPKTLIGKGKLEEIIEFAEANDVGTIIFDEELSPSQQNNIEKISHCAVLDRTSLILSIFASRARTSHAKAQVQLAQYQYMLPRLKRMWTHLERQRGGTGAHHSR